MSTAESNRFIGSGFLFSADDALKPQPPPAWCVDGLFHSPGLFMLIGDAGAKKTYVAMDLSVSVALGKPWLDRPVNQCPVLFIDEQSGASQLLARFNAVLAGCNAPEGVPLHFTSLAGHHLRTKEAAEAVITLAESIRAGLIIIDNFVSLLHGGQESSLAAVLPTLLYLRRLSESCQASVLVIHHTNRDGFFRGSAAIAAAVDLMLYIETQPAASALSFVPLKSRSLLPPVFHAEANFQTSPQGVKHFSLTHLDALPESAPTDPAQSQRRLLVVPPGVQGLAFTLWDDLAHWGQASFEDFCKQHGGNSSGSVRNALQDLLKMGVIVRADDGGKGKKAVYKLAHSPYKDGKY